MKMPGAGPPKVTMAEEDLPKRMFASDHRTANRRWSCLSDRTLAGYADGVLGKFIKSWAEFHLASCGRCRLLIADVVKAQRDSSLPPVPVELRRKASKLAEQEAPRRRWIWAPAGALASAALAGVISLVVMRKPEPLPVVSPPAPSVPVIAESRPPSTHAAPAEIVRNRTSAAPGPRVVFPRPGTVLGRRRLRFGWHQVPHSRYYEVRVVSAAGDLLWEGQTEKTGLQPPADLALQDGAYFVWVTAYLDDGRVEKSAPLRFLVKR